MKSLWNESILCHSRIYSQQSVTLTATTDMAEKSTWHLLVAVWLSTTATKHHPLRCPPKADLAYASRRTITLSRRWQRGMWDLRTWCRWCRLAVARTTRVSFSRWILHFLTSAAQLEGLLTTRLDCGFSRLLRVHSPVRASGCKNRPTPFSGRMSYKANKPGLVCLSYLSMLYYCVVVY